MEDSMLDDVSGTAVDETVSAPAGAPAGSAPVETRDGGAGGAVDSPEEGGAPNQLPKWAYNIVRGNRDLKRQLAELQQRIVAQPRGGNGEKPAPTDVWTNPDEWADAKISKAVTAEIQKAESSRKKLDAYEYVRSQKDVTPENEDEIAAIMQREGYDRLLDHNPKKAADLALRDWREENGIKPEAAGNTALTKARARGVAGTSAPGAGAKKWSETEITAIASDPEKWAKEGPAILEYLKTKDKGRIAA
eukprot:GHVR01074951.1.p2 GENE.GHVR01074951.1~~GHVR01074951.1.p2  ORF type:complete len:248 (+),score=44.39 GHVR01074951.1:281-1024(+)